MPIHSSLLDKPKFLTKLKAFYDHLKKNDDKIFPKDDFVE